MELASSTLEDLTLAGDSIHVPDAVFSVLVEKVFDGIRDDNERNFCFLNGVFCLSSSVLDPNWAEVHGLQ